MSMTKVLEEAFREAEQLPEEDQRVIADFIVHYVHPDQDEEAEWEQLVQTPQSQRFLDKMVQKVRQNKAEGKVLERDPGNT